MNYSTSLVLVAWYTQWLLRMSTISGFQTIRNLDNRRNLVKRSPDIQRDKINEDPKLGSTVSTTCVDNIIFIVHGVGTGDSSLATSAEKFRQTLDTVKEKSFKSAACETHVEVINWKSDIKAEQKSLLDRLKPAASGDVNDLRDMLNSAAADIMYYLTPWRKEALVANVTNKLNTAYSNLLESDPSRFRGAKVALVAHSLGSLIVYDILSSDSDKTLTFPVDFVFAWGSPLAAYLSMKSANNDKINLPTKMGRYFNIYHPLDPLAFRQEAIFFGEEPQQAMQLRKWFTSPFRKQPKPDDLYDVTPRIDYVLPSSIYDAVGITEVLMIKSHSSYWASTDIALHILSKLTGTDTEPFFDNDWSE